MAPGYDHGISRGWSLHQLRQTPHPTTATIPESPPREHRPARPEPGVYPTDPTRGAQNPPAPGPARAEGRP